MCNLNNNPTITNDMWDYLFKYLNTNYAVINTEVYRMGDLVKSINGYYFKNKIQKIFGLPDNVVIEVLSEWLSNCDVLVDNDFFDYWLGLPNLNINYRQVLDNIFNARKTHKDSLQQAVDVPAFNLVKLTEGGYTQGELQSFRPNGIQLPKIIPGFTVMGYL